MYVRTLYTISVDYRKSLENKSRLTFQMLRVGKINSKPFGIGYGHTFA